MKDRVAAPESKVHGPSRQPPIPPILQEALARPGQPLDAVTRLQMERRFGHDFSQVRVHTDPAAAISARAVGARAYTFGREICFGEQQYNPRTRDGTYLLAHELAHVVQQSRGGVTPSLQSHSYLEQAADRSARSLSTTGSITVDGASDIGVARQVDPIQVEPTQQGLKAEEEQRKRFAQLQADLAAHMPFDQLAFLYAEFLPPGVLDWLQSEYQHLGWPMFTPNIRLEDWYDGPIIDVDWQARRAARREYDLHTIGILGSSFIASLGAVFADNPLDRARAESLASVEEAWKAVANVRTGREQFQSVRSAQPERPVAAEIRPAKPPKSPALVDTSSPSVKGIGVSAEAMWASGSLVSTKPTTAQPAVSRARIPAAQPTPAAPSPNDLVLANPRSKIYHDERSRYFHEGIKLGRTTTRAQAEQQGYRPTLNQPASGIPVGKAAEPLIMRQYYPEYSKTAENQPAYDGFKAGEVKSTFRETTEIIENKRVTVVNETQIGGSTLSIRTLGPGEVTPEHIRSAVKQKFKDIVNKGLLSTRRDPKPRPDGRYWRLELVMPSEVVIHVRIIGKEISKAMLDAANEAVKLEFGPGIPKVRAVLEWWPATVNANDESEPRQHGIE
jgi:hypothetical protein